jgi:ribose transport system ATP-binding protein
MMIGREAKNEDDRVPGSRQEANRLEVRNLAYGGLLKDVNFTAYGGEILGVGGLVGSGRTELIKCIYGAEKRSGGTVTLNGSPVSQSIRKNIRAGFGLVPEDRHGEGLIPVQSVERNTTIASYDRLSKFGFVNVRRESRWADDAITNYDIRPPVKSLPVSGLSGGNQQKVILGRWLSRDPRVLLLDEPTVGVDVGVKMDLYALLRKLAATGTIIIVVSSDLAELTLISDRILIMHDGRFFEEFTRGNVTQAAILLASSGVHTEEGTAL